TARRVSRDPGPLRAERGGRLGRSRRAGARNSECAAVSLRHEGPGARRSADRAARSILTSKRAWRNWQTRGVYVPVGLTALRGSSPLARIMNARSLHDDAVVVDAHNDLPVLMLVRNARLGNHKVERYWRDVWVPEARQGGVNVQVLPIYCAPSVAEASLRHSLLQLEALEREAAQTPEVVLCRSGADIDAALAEGRIALLLSLEGTPGIGIDIELFAVFHRLGIRMVSFTHWSRALLADGTADEDAGSRLPRSGVRAVAELERLGILLDVSHLAAPGGDHVL